MFNFNLSVLWLTKCTSRKCSWQHFTPSLRKEDLFLETPEQNKELILIKCCRVCLGVWFHQVWESIHPKESHHRRTQTRDTFLFQNGLFAIQHSDDQLPKTGSALVIAQMLKFKLLEVLEPKGCSCLPLLGSLTADFWFQHSHFWTTTSFNFLY